MTRLLPVLTLLPIIIGLLLRPAILGKLALWYWTRQWRRGKLTFAMQNYEATMRSGGLR